MQYGDCYFGLSPGTNCNNRLAVDRLFVCSFSYAARRVHRAAFALSPSAINAGDCHDDAIVPTAIMPGENIALRWVVDRFSDESSSSK